MGAPAREFGLSRVRANTLAPVPLGFQAESRKSRCAASPGRQAVPDRCQWQRLVIVSAALWETASLAADTAARLYPGSGLLGYLAAPAM
jgi:hypothetical protein